MVVLAHHRQSGTQVAVKVMLNAGWAYHVNAAGESHIQPPRYHDGICHKWQPVGLHQSTWGPGGQGHIGPAAGGSGVLPQPADITPGSEAREHAARCQYVCQMSRLRIELQHPRRQNGECILQNIRAQRTGSVPAMAPGSILSWHLECQNHY